MRWEDRHLGRRGLRKRTDFSACCWKCTKMMVDTAKSDVPARAIFEPREAIVAERVGLMEGEKKSRF